MDIVIRPERGSDLTSIRTVNRAAFDTAAEAGLVEALRANGHATISLVAEVRNEVVGHILFSPMTFEERSEVARPLGLAPMAVIPAWQRMGIGSKLVREGLAQCGVLGCQAVFVLGHPDYYPRFDFVPASRFGIRSTYDVPDEAFMAIEIVEGALARAGGVVRYGSEFESV